MRERNNLAYFRLLNNASGPEIVALEPPRPPPFPMVLLFFVVFNGLHDLSVLIDHYLFQWVLR